MTYNPLVQLLRTYGPSAASDSLYDEHVRKGAKRFGVEEFRIRAPLVETIGSILNSDAPTNIILTGTAGDGKTWHIRQVFADLPGGERTAWPGDDLVLTVSLQGGRTLRVIRDLSEFPASRKAEEIDGITRSLTGRDPDTVYLIAANDGQLLEMWRVATENSPKGSEHHLVHLTLSRMLHEDCTEDPVGKLSFKLFNLSHRTEEAERSVVGDVIDELLAHPQWQSGCEGCSLAADQDRCPIQINRRLLLGDEKPDSRNFRGRLQGAIEIAAANGQHIPLRQIISLVVNIVLGDHKDHDAPLMTCETACKRAEKDAYRNTNPYASAVGLNLTSDTRSRYGVFSVLDGLGIGAESTNRFDRLLLFDDPSSTAERLEEIDPIYGRSVFHETRAQYLQEPRHRSRLSQFPSAIASQRRRLFFQMPDDRQVDESIWLLTVLHNGSHYLDFKHAVATDSGSRTRIQSNVIDHQMFKIVRGMNRALTGFMTSEDSLLWIASSIGKADDPSGIIATTGGIPRNVSGMSLFHIRECHDENRNIPCLEVTSQHLPDFDPPRIGITPYLFEYLVRVSKGYLPTSFSSQCQQEIKHFAMVVRESMARILGYNRRNSVDIRFDDIKILSLDSEASIKSQAIKVMKA